MNRNVYSSPQHDAASICALLGAAGALGLVETPSSPVRRQQRDLAILPIARRARKAHGN